jgi:hypothetical protein
MSRLTIRPWAWLSGPAATPAVLAATGRPWLAVLSLGLVVCLLGVTLLQDLRSQERREQAALLLAPLASQADADPAAVLRAVQRETGGAGGADDATQPGAEPCDRLARRWWTLLPRR